MEESETKEKKEKERGRAERKEGIDAVIVKGRRKRKKTKNGAAEDK